MSLSRTFFLCAVFCFVVLFHRQLTRLAACFCFCFFCVCVSNLDPTDTRLCILVWSSSESMSLNELKENSLSLRLKHCYFGKFTFFSCFLWRFTPLLAVLRCTIRFCCICENLALFFRARTLRIRERVVTSLELLVVQSVCAAFMCWNRLLPLKQWQPGTE